MLHVNQTQLFTQDEPPGWVQEWVEKRTQTAQKKEEKQKAPVDEVAQAKRQQKRSDQVSAGIADLDLWLQDLISSGYQRLESLSPELAAEVRSQVGWTTAQDDLLGLFNRGEVTSHQDDWLVMGKSLTEDAISNLKTQRVWLWGQNSQRVALILHFAVRNQPLDVSWLPGSLVPAELIFFPSSYPLRALDRHRQDARQPEMIPGDGSIELAIDRYRQALIHNPWLDTFPLLIKDVTPSYNDGNLSSCRANCQKGFNVIATANNRDKGVNELSSALKRRFNTVILPVPDSADEEVAIVHKRVESMGRALELPIEVPALAEIRRVVTIFRELRSGVTGDGKTKLKTPSGTMSTAEAISVVNSGMALAAHFGDGTLQAGDVARLYLS